ncbi:Heat shock protein DnaJ [Penicillium hispanicum]|uniref:Heat shock protein DnaJ n=1 Tax=Penicillium hispanicum TaxID=1080232 RepID=UPI002542429A|nr:Heat shock protein DnaJ [Penicillium hispanicum]KAJ5594557.1 Heat shock protein DnaJ [Penicillium hispanicum]
MGQSQSSGSKASPGQQSIQKTGYYELLGVTRSATDDEIKKAYRRKALDLHPDRNYNNVEEATRLFAEVQAAYEVLADPQERAWYDSHSDAFLGTNEGSEDDQHLYDVRLTTAEDVLKVFSQFSPRMEFSNAPTGFFGGLQEQFSRLALEERLACRWEDQDEIEYPSFGANDDDFETVVRPFYAAWSGFSTRKSFAWKDAYRYSEAPDRRVRRLMEKENRRLREEGIREFNDAVRSLVAFVKKRDPRYKAHAQSEFQRQQTLRQSAAAQAARSRAMNNAKMREHVVPEWAQSEKPTADDEETSDSEVESFECVACSKHFKSQKQFEAHERSKKHLKAVKQLCRDMQMENDQLDLEPNVDSRNFPGQAAPIHVAGTSNDGDPRITNPSGKQTDNIVLEDITTTWPIESEAGDVLARQESNTKAPVLSLLDPERESSDSTEDDDYAPRKFVETRLRRDLDSLAEDSVMPLTEQLSSSGMDDHTPTLPMGKAKQKRAKKAAREQAEGIMCTNCRATFTSRTKLFAHIKEKPTHAQPLRAAKNEKP